MQKILCPVAAVAASLLLSFGASFGTGGVAWAQYVRGVRVTVAPPVLRVEARPVAPSPRHLWIAGYWGWRGGRHIWLPGHWAMPPATGYVWEPARWENDSGAWTFYDGHWRLGEAVDATHVYQPLAPPVEPVVVE